MKGRIIIFAALAAFLPAIRPAAAAQAEKAAPPPISFEPLPMPETAAEKTALRVSPKAVTWCCGGKRGEHALEYRLLVRGGTADKDGHIAGLVVKANGEAMKQDGVAARTSRNPAAASIIEAGGSLYAFTQFDETPGAVYLLQLEAGKNQTLGVKELAPIDLSQAAGAAATAGGTKTPWNTHLAAEGSFWLDAYWFTPAAAPYSARHISRCQSGETGNRDGPEFLSWCSAVQSAREYLAAPDAFDPYRYGYALELGADRHGAAPVKDGAKHFALGRTAPRAVIALPDRRTVYLAGAGGYAGFFMFIADDRGDLSVGTLYMAQWRQQPNGAAVRWLPLGHASDKEIGAILDLKTAFTDIFDVGDPLVCPDGYRIIKAGPAGANCLRLRDGKNGSAVAAKFGTRTSPLAAAAFLEPARYGALLGGAAEWNDAQGLAYDDDRNTLYLAVGSVAGGMTANLDPADSIRLPKNICGAILRLRLGEARDTLGRKIKSPFVAAWAELALEGLPLSPGLPYAEENGCHPDFIAGPGAMQYIGHNILLIGEDSPLHFNNYAWAYNVERKSLARIASAPTGGGFGGLAAYDTAERFYLLMNIRHPLGNAALNAAGKQVNGPLLDGATDQQRKGYIGYLWGLPSLGR